VGGPLGQDEERPVTSILTAVTQSPLHVLVVAGIAACWGAFVVAWLAGALYNAARGPAQRTRTRFSPVMLVGAFIGWAVFRAVPYADWQALTLEAPWVRMLGLAILIGSTVFTLWARLVLCAMWNSDPIVKQGHELRTDGPYGITRHPIYTGMLGMLLGTVLLAGVGQQILIFPVGLLLFEIKIGIEEPLMSATFPDEYPRYRQRVPKLIPGLRIIGRRQGIDVNQTDPQVRSMPPTHPPHTD
jgi:protein-S-isoprenylcysteine O-methyltransferase Ste14